MTTRCCSQQDLDKFGYSNPWYSIRYFMKQVSSRFLSCILLFLIAGVSHVLMAQSSSVSDIQANKIVVKLASGFERSPAITFWDQPAGKQVLRQIGATKVSPAFPGNRSVSSEEMVDLSSIYTIFLSSGVDERDAARQLGRLTQIEYAEPLWIHHTFYLPNDPLADTLNNGGQWYLDQIHAYEAWDIAKGDTSIVIAIIDAGQSRHPDLFQNIAFNHADPIDGIDNDGDGYVDNYEGWDFSGATSTGFPDNDPFVGSSHGLWVAGVSSALTDNDLGMSGTGFNCRYIPLKAAPDDSLGLIFNGYEAIVYAADHGAQIINCSWGSSQPSRLGADVIKYATINKKAAVIAAAGNSQRKETFYPAGYPEVLSVASSSFQDTVFSGVPGLSGTTYDETVDVSAPGFAITSCNGENQYSRSFTGTSFASPVAAGGVGIVMSHFPGLTGFQAAQRLRVTSDPIDSLNSSQYHDRIGLGRINLYRALTDPLKPSIRIASYEVNNQQGDSRMSPGDTIDIVLTWVNQLHPSSTDLLLRAEMSVLNTPFITVLKNEVLPGIVGMDQQFTRNAITIVLAQTLPEDYPVTFRYSYEDSALQYDDFEYFVLRVNPTWLTMDVNAITATITSEGKLGFKDFPDNEQGDGVSLNGAASALYEGGVMFSNSINQVSDAIRNVASVDKDFRAVNPVYVDFQDQRADMVVKGTFDDMSAASPMGIQVTQEAFGWSRVARRNFIILQYIVENQGQNNLPGVYASMFTDWDLTSGLVNRNAANYSQQLSLAFTEDLTGFNPNKYGIAVLSEDGFSTYAKSAPNTNTFSSAGKSTAMRTPLSPGAGAAGYPSGTDVYQFTNTGPFSINASEKDTVVFLLMAGTNGDLPVIRAEGERAWKCDVLDQGPNTLFTVSDLLPVIGDSVMFMDVNSGAQAWNWDFGDGTTSSVAAPTHFYDSTGSYTVSLTVSDGYCTQTLKRELKILQATSVSDFQKHALSVSPNPGNGTFELKIPASGAFQMRIFSSNGQLAWRSETRHHLAGDSLQIETALPDGVYVLLIEGESYVGSVKIVIQE